MMLLLYSIFLSSGGFANSNTFKNVKNNREHRNADVSCDLQKLPPVFHQPDLPLAGDLLGVLWRRALHGAWGCRRHHDALGQARVWRAQLVGRDVSCGSCGGVTGRRVEFETFTHVASAWRVSGLLCFLKFFLWKVTLSALLPVLEDRCPQTVAVKGFLFWKMTSILFWFHLLAWQGRFYFEVLFCLYIESTLFFTF